MLLWSPQILWRCSQCWSLWWFVSSEKNQTERGKHQMIKFCLKMLKIRHWSIGGSIGGRSYTRWWEPSPDVTDWQRTTKANHDQSIEVQKNGTKVHTGMFPTWIRQKDSKRDNSNELYNSKPDGHMNLVLYCWYVNCF